MRKITILVCIILFSISAHSQKWENLIGLPWRNDMQGKILEHYDGGYMITGNIRYDGDNVHGWLIKTDINGQVLWDKVITVLPDVAQISKTLVDTMGNIYVFGWLFQDQPHEFPFVVKLDACGELQWCRLLAIEGYDYGFFNDAIFLDNGDLLGLAIMPEDDPSNNNRIILFRISPEGDIIWKKGYATHENHPYYGDPYGARIYQFGDIYMIVGNVYSPYPNSPNPYHVYQRPMFIGIDENFEEDWIVEFGINDSLLGKAEAIIPINDTLFMGVGRYRYFNELGIYDECAWLMFFNRQGEQVGFKILEDEQFGSEVLGSYLFGVEKSEDYRYILATGYMYDEEENYANGEIVVDTSGSVFNYAIRVNTRGGSIYIAKTFDKKYTLNTNYRLPNQTTSDIYLYKINENLEQDTIYLGNYTYDSLCKNLPIQSGVIDLAGCDVITGIGEIPTPEQYYLSLKTIPVKAFPNPAIAIVNLEFENTEHHQNLQLRCYNMHGSLVHSEPLITGQKGAAINISRWPPGMYVTIVTGSGGASGKCKFVVEKEE